MDIVPENGHTLCLQLNVDKNMMEINIWVEASGLFWVEKCALQNCI